MRHSSGALCGGGRARALLAREKAKARSPDLRTSNISRAPNEKMRFGMQYQNHDGLDVTKSPRSSAHHELLKAAKTIGGHVAADRVQLGARTG